MTKYQMLFQLTFTIVLVFLIFFSYQRFFKESVNIAVVDVNRIMQESQAAVAARQHVEEAQKILQTAFDGVVKEWEKAAENEKQKVTQEAFLALNRQLENEKQAAQKVVEDILHAEITKWRAKNKVTIVVNLQMFLEADKALDVTDEILARMNQVKPVFADLPSVKVVKRDEAKEPEKKEKPLELPSPRRD